MAGTLVQKIFAAHAGRDSVKVGEIVVLRPDFVLSHDNTSAIIGHFGKTGATHVFDPNRIVIVLDHIVPASEAVIANNHKEVRQFVKEQGIPHFYDVGYGVCHQVFPEEGFALPGLVIVGADSHTTTYGAFGAFATGVGRSEVAAVWATGELWLLVPESIRIVLTGEFQKFVTPKDLALTIIGNIGADGALYQSVEFAGSGAQNLDISGRMTLANLTAEMGAKNGIFYPDEKTLDYIGDKAKMAFTPIMPDPDAVYVRELGFDLGEIEPVLASPHTVDNLAKINDYAGTPVDQVIIGTCTNGRIDDLRQAAELLKSHKVAKSTRTLIFPASRTVLQQAVREGVIDILLEAGCTLMNPGCGPCLGAHEGVLADDEVCVSTANRNFKGRMGNPTGKVFLASPYTAAATAIRGVIADPREFDDSRRFDAERGNR